MRFLFGLVVLVAGCDVAITRIDSRYDAGPRPGVDAPGVDAGGSGSDGGRSDGGGGSDGGGCTLETPTPPAAWVPVDTGGPAGETVAACLSRVGSRTDDRLPEDQAYELTTFGGPGDEQPVACGGPDADGTWYYAANRQRFACGQRIRIVTPDRAHCVIVEVADLGPNACVEEAGGAPIWDVSPLAADELVGRTSVGYSEHEELLAAPVGSANTLGPCPAPSTLSGLLAGFVGGPCASDADCTYTGGRCLTAAEGFPGGYCTLDCATGSCPDRAGAFAYTGCAAIDGAPSCAARCDYTLFADGCRPGYGCETVPHPVTPTLPARRVCLPLECL